MSKALRPVFKLLTGLLIFIGLPVLSWGVRDAGGFFQHPARLLYCVMTVVLQVLTIIRLPDSGRGGGQKETETGQRRVVLALIQIVSLSLLIVAPGGDRRGLGVFADSGAERFFGLLLYTLGYLKMHRAERYLAEQFSIKVTVQKDHILITDGPYRVIRHPRYLGIIVFSAGIALIFRSWAGLILCAVLGVVLLTRIQDEEKLMLETFGEEWTAYSQKTSHIIPYIY